MNFCDCAFVVHDGGQLHLDEALNVTSHRRGNVKDIAKGFKGESRQAPYYHPVTLTWYAAVDCQV